MKNLKKGIISFVLAVMMIVSIIPMAGAEETPEAIDLIHTSDGSLREGVYLSTNNGVYQNNGVDYAATSLEKAYDNSTGTRWWSKYTTSPKDTFLQVNLPVPHQLTNITVVSGDGDYKVPFKVLVSNDVNFETSKELLSLSSVNASEKHSVDVTDTTAYRYVRVVDNAASHGRLGIYEIDVTGYEAELPDVSGDDVLSSRGDVIASISRNPYHSDANYAAQTVLDGSSATFVMFTASSANSYLQLDLRRKSPISKVGFIGGAGDKSYAAALKNYQILLSNDPEFTESVVIYQRYTAATVYGNWTYAYSHDDTPYRYVRIQKTSSSDGWFTIPEMKVWGTEKENLTVTNLAQSSTVSATTNTTKAALTTDKKILNTYGWLNTQETGKAAITYSFTEPEIITSLAIFPLYNTSSDTARKNFNIYGSLNGDFEDSELIASVGETALINAQYNNFEFEDAKEYKAIKIESTVDATPADNLGLNEVMIICDSSKAVSKVENVSPSNEATAITNVDGQTNFVEVELNKAVNAQTINPENITITNETDGTVLENWQAYSVEGNAFKIDIANFASNKTYSITLSTDVLAGNLPLAEDYTFAFTTGTIINAPYREGKIIKNVALNKAVTGDVVVASGYPLSNLVDSSSSTMAHTAMATGKIPNLQVDLGNEYEIIAARINSNNYCNDLKILYSMENVPASEMTNLIGTKVNKSGTEMFTLDTYKKARYIGLYKSKEIVAIYDLKVYAYVDEALLNENISDFYSQGVIEADSTVTGTCLLSSYVEGDSVPTVVTALYKQENGITSLVTADINDTVENNKICSSVTIPNDGGNYFVKVFLFDNITNIKPMSAMILTD